MKFDDKLANILKRHFEMRTDLTSMQRDLSEVLSGFINASSNLEGYTGVIFVDGKSSRTELLRFKGNRVEMLRLLTKDADLMGNIAQVVSHKGPIH